MSEKSSYSFENDNLEKIKTLGEELEEKSYSIKLLETELNNLVPDGLWAKYIKMYTFIKKNILSVVISGDACFFMVAEENLQVYITNFF